MNLHTKGGHIALDILSRRYSQKTQTALKAINSAICTIFFGLVAWQIALWSTTLWKVGDVTETLRIIYYPFTYGVALGFAALSFVFFTAFLECLSCEKGSKS